MPESRERAHCCASSRVQKTMVKVWIGTQDICLFPGTGKAILFAQ